MPEIKGPKAYGVNPKDCDTLQAGRDRQDRRGFRPGGRSLPDGKFHRNVTSD